MPYVQCQVCEEGGRFEHARDVGRIRSNVRKFQKEAFTVWRCPSCGSLHSLEDIDYERYYNGYPMQRQKPDFFTRRLFAARLRQLTARGFEKNCSLIDYGCGNGGFVKWLREKGYARVAGYDPYCEPFADKTPLNETYDFLISQDVLEHAPDPRAMLDGMLRCVGPCGVAVLGSPCADRIRLNDPLDEAGPLHQPYHRHILAQAQLIRLLDMRGFDVFDTETRWYLDTWIPFLNSTFLFQYVLATGGAEDVFFEPIRFGLILRSPRLLAYGLLGRLWNPGKDMTVFARRSQPLG